MEHGESSTLWWMASGTPQKIIAVARGVGPELMGLPGHGSTSPDETGAWVSVGLG